MTGKELYEKYKGRLAADDGSITGTICGYGHHPTYGNLLLMAVTGLVKGWTSNDIPHTIVTHQDNELGYWWVDEEDVLPEE